jgi:formylglycine-generating enzyme required for sulfatase activity
VEPNPLTTIDRLVRVRLEPGVRGRLVVLLDRVCAGAMPILGEEGPGEDARSCVSTPEELVRVPIREVEREVMIVPSSKLAAEVDCGDAAGDDRVCIPGGATLLGSSELGLFPDLEPRPERLVVHSPFWIDRYEVTVGRFRDALARGFVPTVMPAVNEGPITGTVEGSCTWSSVDVGREGYALSCVSWQTAREFCLFEGGDLPTEAQFEHMATLASDLGRSRYPWGDEAPTCDRAVYGRVELAGFPGVCEHIGTGPLPIDPEERMDITREGVVGLAGGIGEWMRDDYAEYRDACWGDASTVDPTCVDETAALKASRGASWAAPPTILPSAVRLGADPLGRRSFQGFRCMYPEAR